MEKRVKMLEVGYMFILWSFSDSSGQGLLKLLDVSFSNASRNRIADVRVAEDLGFRPT